MHETITMSTNCFHIDSFLDQGTRELQRAERYRVFVSLLLLDLSSVRERFGGRGSEIMQMLTRLTCQHVRGCDIVAAVNGSIALLFPETPRQGAEITSKRLSDMIREKVSELSEQAVETVIPLEIASYPDTAGARSLSEFLDELSSKRPN